ncbi:hypothetical protein ACUN24_20035 [Pedobacter sp. WC2501]|uniref:hypothetical protein n=1 Tax=Pedobacter sp. WC2501 TaxID=3461400 RepID=UPI00404656D4
MFRKIRSNSAPYRTVPVALYHEFRPYLVLLRRRMVRLLKAYPKQVFKLMVTIVAFSLLFSFGLFPLQDKKEVKELPFSKKEKSTKQSYAIDDGLSRIGTTGTKLKKTLEIRKQVDSVLDKGALSNADSVFLEAKLEELRMLH